MRSSPKGIFLKPAHFPLDCADLSVIPGRREAASPPISGLPEIGTYDAEVG
jgi:hypothetical protein